ncbi:MAG TPA: type II toxin-antitoxin system VapC family toxin [Bryobacteraceae bacterium]|nr:type II toxin-antitoxin system VapC family toxin [Bryobacteraceae bacterium]
MILIDANLLLYAYDSGSEFHRAAADWLAEALSGPDLAGLAWVTVLAFLRISTHPRMRAQPFTSAEAVAVVQEWLDQPCVRMLTPTARHWTILRDLISKGQAKAALVTDAHLAALAIEHGAVLCTSDRDFTRFSGLKWSNPLGRA